MISKRTHSFVLSFAADQATGALIVMAGVKYTEL